MNLTHAMLWRPEQEVFRCRWGGCGFEVTEAEMSGAGYRVFKDGVVFVDEESLEKVTNDEENDSSNI